jgi:hypothetical protein
LTIGFVKGTNSYVEKTRNKKWRLRINNNLHFSKPIQALNLQSSRTGNNFCCSKIIRIFLTGLFYLHADHSGLAPKAIYSAIAALSSTNVSNADVLKLENRPSHLS